jgi:ABC-type glycerol-3-phosphate transport system substrate-binding protein
MSWQGKYWAMMQHPDIVFMWYATGLMEENGVATKTLPTTWQQFDELVLKLTKKIGTDGFEFIGFAPHIGQAWQIAFTQANGAKLVSDDARKAQLDSAEVLEALEWGKAHVKRLGGLDVIDKWRTTVPPGDNQAPGTATSGADSFAQKKIGAIHGGNWYADNIRRANKRLGQTLKFGCAPIPSGPRGPKDNSKNIYAGGVLVAGAKGTKKLDQAWEFFKYIATKEGGLNVQRNTSDVCANKEAARDPSIVDSPDTGTGRKDFLQFFDQGSGARDFKHPAAVEIRAEYNKVVNAFLRDQTGSLREDMKEANRLAQQKIDDFFQQNPNAGK